MVPCAQLGDGTDTLYTQASSTCMLVLMAGRSSGLPSDRVLSNILVAVDAILCVNNAQHSSAGLRLDC
jgi:hypothetical protein